MTETDTLFIHTLDDLERRIVSKDWYEVLGASAFIRKLLLDEFPLVDRVNQLHKLKINFLIVDYDLIGARPTIALMGDGLDPDTSPPNVKTRLVNRAQFLKTIIFVAGDKQYSVRDVVLFEANVMGGVHAGSPKNEQERVLKQVNKFFLFSGGRASLQELCSIGRIVLKALKPLRAKIEEKL